jgi:drug/metabolite transporter (DMT)-like permease
MPGGKTQLHFKAVRMLIGATFFWAISFPITKSIALLEKKLLGDVSTWFYTALTGVTRFGIATLVLLLVCARALKSISRLELWQGLGLGVFGGVGILLQMDGLAHTAASISAFLTQTFCVYVPIIVAVRDRQWPSKRIVGSTLLMLLGVAILNDISLQHFALGRGEWETLLAALIFSGQILWLERPIFQKNNVYHMSLAMFATMALLSLPVLLFAMTSPSQIALCYSNPSVLALNLALAFLCTVIAYVAMNKWQPYVPASEASIIYGVEPVLTSLFALFLPAILSRWTGIRYPNEILTWNLIFGGVLIFSANLIVQLPSHKTNE